MGFTAPPLLGNNSDEGRMKTISLVYNDEVPFTGSVAQQLQKGHRN
jgi:hypothetical protein